MSKKTLRLIAIISLVFNLTFISAFIYRGIQISKLHHQPFPHPFQKPPRPEPGMGHSMGKMPVELQKKFMSKSIKTNMKAMGDLKKRFFKELMVENPDYNKLEELKKEMAMQSQSMSNCMSDKIIEVRKTSTLEETKRFQAMFDRHTNRFRERDHKPRRKK